MLTAIQQDPKDPRDYLYEPEAGDLLLSSPSNVTLPNAVDLRNFCTPIESQGQAGSCTAAATCACAEMFDNSKDRSKLFNYYTSRQIIGPPYDAIDAGSTARAALKAANQSGLPDETIWPYNLTYLNSKPSQAAYDDAAKSKVTEYYRIATTPGRDTVMRLAKYAMACGYPILIAANVGTKLRYLPATSIYQGVDYPNDSIWGQHEFLIVGYNDTDNTCICKNSWGAGWCDNGYFRAKQNIIYDDSLDLWIMKGFNDHKTVGPKQVMYPAWPADSDIRAYVEQHLDTPENIQLVIDGMVFYRIPASHVEIVMSWLPGSIKAYSTSIGASLNWVGVIW